MNKLENLPDYADRQNKLVFEFMLHHFLSSYMFKNYFKYGCIISPAFIGTMMERPNAHMIVSQMRLP